MTDGTHPGYPASSGGDCARRAGIPDSGACEGRFTQHPKIIIPEKKGKEKGEKREKE